MTHKYHVSVLLSEVISWLKVIPGGKYIDCTLGDAGHTIEILKLGGHVLGLDFNDVSLGQAMFRVKELGLATNFKGIKANFKDVGKVAAVHGFNCVDGIIFDLGYSSSQLEHQDIGLSFLEDQPLDMRLSQDLGVTAADLVNALPEKQLADLIYEYSGENLAKKFAKALVARRILKKFQTTKDLSEFLFSVAPSGYESSRIHPATRTFQALRIAVNDELNNLRISLPEAAHLLLPGRRMAVISFHSLEDKIVKDFYLGVQPCFEHKDGERRLEGTLALGVHLDQLTKTPIVPTVEEVELNRRSRSAKMRVFERCP